MELEFLSHSSSLTRSIESMAVGDSTISSSRSAVCPWSHDLSPSVSISNNMAKARRAFFAQQANGIAYSKQNPLTSRELLLVLPVCLYGSESWLLTEPMLGKLEYFQGDLGKKIFPSTTPTSSPWSPNSSQKAGISLAYPVPEDLSVFESLREKGTAHSAVQVPGKRLWNSLHRDSPLSEQRQCTGLYHPGERDRENKCHLELLSLQTSTGSGFGLSCGGNSPDYSRHQSLRTTPGQKLDPMQSPVDHIARNVTCSS